MKDSVNWNVLMRAGPQEAPQKALTAPNLVLGKSRGRCSWTIKHCSQSAQGTQAFFTAASLSDPPMSAYLPQHVSGGHWIGQVFTRSVSVCTVSEYRVYSVWVHVCLDYNTARCSVPYLNTGGKKSFRVNKEMQFLKRAQCVNKMYCSKWNIAINPSQYAPFTGIKRPFMPLSEGIPENTFVHIFNFYFVPWINSWHLLFIVVWV